MSPQYEHEINVGEYTAAWSDGEAETPQVAQNRVGPLIRMPNVVDRVRVSCRLARLGELPEASSERASRCGSVSCCMKSSGGGPLQDLQDLQHLQDLQDLQHLQDLQDPITGTRRRGGAETLGGGVFESRRGVPGAG